MSVMIRRISLLLLFVLSAVTGFRCKREKVSPAVLMGKLVVIGACDHFVVKVLSGPIPDSSVLVKSWTNSLTDSTYTNVFMVQDVCTFAEVGLYQGQVFSFSFSNNPPAQTCLVCDVVPFAGPSVLNSVVNIQPAAID
jgi:hypothetical protein